MADFERAAAFGQRAAYVEIAIDLDSAAKITLPDADEA